MEEAISLCPKQTCIDHKAGFCLTLAKNIKVYTVGVRLLEEAGASLMN